MTMFGSPWFGSAGAAFTIDQSCRFDSASSSYFSTTYGSAGNRRIGTVSCWFKRASIGTQQCLFNPHNSDADQDQVLQFNSSGSASVTDSLSIWWDAAYYGDLSTTQAFTDMVGWNHLVATWDTTQATAADRNKIYFNGTEITSLVSWTGGAASYPTQNREFWFNGAYTHAIGRRTAYSGQHYFDGYLAEVISVDGTAYAPSQFGETVDSVWVPKNFSGSYGTNGFYLDFADSADLGADQSGNSNDFTSSGLASSDQMKDSPTNNFAVFDTLVANAPVANWKELNLETAGAGWSSTRWAAMSTLIIPTDKKIYFEVNSSVNHGSYYSFGGGTASSVPSSTYVGGTGSVTYLNAAAWVNGSEVGSYGTRIAAGEIGQCAIDGATGKVWFGKDNTWFSSGDPAAGSSEAGTITNGGAEDLHVVVAAYGTVMLNFGQDSSFDGDETRQNNADGDGFGDFYYAPPSGFLALCTKNGATL